MLRISARPPRADDRAMGPAAVQRDPDILASFVEDAAHYPGGHAAAVAARAASFIAEHDAQVGPRKLDGRHQSKENSGKHADAGCKREYAPIDVYLAGAR